MTSVRRWCSIGFEWKHTDKTSKICIVVRVRSRSRCRVHTEERRVKVVLPRSTRDRIFDVITGICSNTDIYLKTKLVKEDSSTRPLHRRPSSFDQLFLTDTPGPLLLIVSDCDSDIESPQWDIASLFRLQLVSRPRIVKRTGNTTREHIRRIDPQPYGDPKRHFAKLVNDFESGHALRPVSDKIHIWPHGSSSMIYRSREFFDQSNSLKLSPSVPKRHDPIRENEETYRVFRNITSHTCTHLIDVTVTGWQNRKSDCCESVTFCVQTDSFDVCQIIFISQSITYNRVRASILGTRLTLR